MKKRIVEELRILEKEKGIKILMAVETGSRAWGFPSPDSDYDVRFIYQFPKNEYLKMRNLPEEIHQMCDNRNLDFTGWELRKSFQLLWKSNASLLERINSPIVYINEENFKEELELFAKDYFLPQVGLYHYKGLGYKYFQKIKDEETYKLKDFFYALRAALACKWIMETKQSVPVYMPEMFSIMKSNLGFENEVVSLIDLKSNMPETYRHNRNDSILNFIDSVLKEADVVEKLQSKQKNTSELLDDFLIKTFKDV